LIDDCVCLLAIYYLQAEKCTKCLKESVYLNWKDPALLHQVSHLKVPEFTAMGYFTVDRRLAITVNKVWI
jgi:hypothetical protein